MATVVIFKYKLKRCSKKECCQQCRYVKFKGTMTKWQVRKLTHRHKKYTNILLHKCVLNMKRKYIDYNSFIQMTFFSEKNAF